MQLGRSYQSPHGYQDPMMQAPAVTYGTFGGAGAEAHGVREYLNQRSSKEFRGSLGTAEMSARLAGAHH